MNAAGPVSTAIVVGNPKAKSRTYHAAQIVLERLTERPPDLAIDLTELGPALLDWSDARVAEAMAAVQATDLVLFASPTYKATYTGLLKGFCDRVPTGGLSGSNKGSRHDMRGIDHSHVHGTIPAAQGMGIRDALRVAALHALEYRHDILGAPPVVAHAGPAREILSAAADVVHALKHRPRNRAAHSEEIVSRGKRSTEDPLRS